MARIFISKTSFDGNFHKLAHKSSSDNVLKPRDLNRPYFGKKDLKIYYPLPKGDSPYALGKKAEYIEKDLDKAADYYKKAIQDSDRAESAVKDLVGVLHQQGKTLEAMEILQKHADLFESEKDKFENIYLNLQRQLLYKGNRLNKYLKISPIPKNSKYLFITSLFSKPQRITDIRVEEDSALVKFSSHSAARKTLETFKFWDKYKIEWVSVNGETVGDAFFKGENSKGKKFYGFLEKKNDEAEVFEFSQNEAEKCLGKDLLDYLDN